MNPETFYRDIQHCKGLVCPVAEMGEPIVMSRAFHEAFYSSTSAFARRCGEDHRTSKLTTKAVLKIRELYDAGGRGSDHADDFSIHPTTFNRIGLRNSWRHLP